MEKKSFYYFSLAAILAGSLASCQEADQGFSAEEIARAKFEKEYQANFERDYGKIAPGHTWGFSEKMGTRAVVGFRRYKCNRNRSEKINLAPDNTPYSVDKVYGEDQTPYDLTPGWSQDYQISKDQDMVFINENCPPAVTDDERKYVFSYLQDPSQHEGGSETCDFGSYFCQNLGINPHTYTGTKTDANGQTSVEITNAHMDLITVDGLHLGDYNTGDVSSLYMDYYYSNTNLSNPYYHESWGESDISGKARFFYIPPKKNAYPNGGDFPGGFYLCFDYATTAKPENGTYPGDGYYDDWVIKIAPGRNDRHRVFCEDLGSTFDLDFNDLVFDYSDSGFGIEVNVLALIGTLPITMSDGINTKVIKTGNAIQENVNDTYFFDNASSIRSLQIAVETSGQGTCFIANTPGRAPYMLRCPVGTMWPAENQRIEKKYPEFSLFVADTQVPWWGNYKD